MPAATCLGGRADATESQSDAFYEWFLRNRKRGAR